MFRFPSLLLVTVLAVNLIGQGMSGVRANDKEIAQADSTPPPALPDDFVPQQFQIADGFRAELAAGSPLVNHPTMGCFDDRGRLFICDGAGVNMSAQELEQNLPNRISMLEDRDGDGRFDKSTVFADRMTFPMGGAWHDGALFVASPPNIWRLEDTDGDGVADKRDIIVDKFGYTGNAASIHGCFFSPDGRLYWCDGYHGHEFKDKDGNLVSQKKGSYIFSCLSDGSDVRIHCGGGMDNPVEVDFTEEGDVIGTVNILYSRPRVDCLVHWQYGGAYPHREAFLEEWPVTGELLGPIHRFGHVAISGTTRYRSGVMNHNWRNNFFATQFNVGRVVRIELERSGSTYSATERQFLSCNSRDFHPTDVIEDADGSLLVVDTGGWFYRGCPTSQIAKPDILGGIYRIRCDGMTTAPDPRGNRINWANRTPAELMQDLKEPRWAVREKAIQECVRRGEAIIDHLTSTVKSADIVARRNALWTLAGISGKRKATSSPHDDRTWLNPARAAVYEAMKDKDAGIRQVACHVLGEFRPHKDSFDHLAAATHDSAPAVRREAYSVLGRTGHAGQPDWLDAGSDTPGITRDREERHARSFAILESGRSVGEATYSDELAGNAEALVVADQRYADGVGVKQLRHCLAQGTPDVLQVTASIVQRRRDQKRLTEQQSSDLEQTVVARLRTLLQNPSEAIRDELSTTLIEAFGPSAAIQQELCEFLRSDSTAPEQQVFLLRAIAGTGVGTSDELEQILIGLMSAEDRNVQEAAILAAGAVAPDRLMPSMMSQFHPQQPELIRLAILKAVARVRSDQTNVVFNHLVTLITHGSPAEQTLCTQLMSNFPMTDQRLQVLAPLLKNSGPQQITDLASLFRRSMKPDLAAMFLDSLENARSLNSLPMIDVSEVVKSFPPELHDRANSLLDRMKATEQEKLLKLDSLVGVLKDGDAARGKDVFFSEKAKCATCHVTGVKDNGNLVGKRVGPDLTTIGVNRAAKDLLESIVFPSATIVRQYEPYTLVTDAGRTYSGLVIKETSTEVTIQQSTGDPVTVARGEIEDLVPGTVSIMPKGLDEQLTAQQIADLVVWLQTLRR